MIRLATRAEARDWVARHGAALDACDNPFAGSAWMRHFIDQVAGDDWQFALCEVGGGSLMLVVRERAGPAQWRALTNYYASLFTPFVATRSAAERRQLVGEFSALRPRPASVELSPLAGEQAEEAEVAFRAAGWITRRFDTFGNWYLPCEGLGFEAYMEARPSQLVNTWRRRARKFAVPGAAARPGRLQLVCEPAEVAAAMQAYGHVYAKSWKQPEPYPDFVAGWAAVCAERGWLRLGIAWWEDQPVAAQFWFTVGGRAFIYKLAYDEAHAALSAGTVLSAFLFRQALDIDRVKEIDYLTGDDAYKRAWVTHRRQRVGVLACNPRTLIGAGRAAYEMAGLLKQRLMRRSVPASAGTPALLG